MQYDPAHGVSLGAMKRAALASTSIATHEARLAMADPRMHMTIDELRLMQGDGTDRVTGLLPPGPTEGYAQIAKAARRAARMGDVPVVINRKPAKPKPKPKRKHA